MKQYIANYTDKSTAKSWDLFVRADNRKDAERDARAATRGLMAGCRFESIHLDKSAR